ncbi:MAG: energy-coupling factor transporter ATPase [Candidatus Latescibacterota bacterium]
MVRFEGFSFRYPGAEESALKDIDLCIEDGEFVLLAGISGCGKSTLLYAVNGLIPHLFPGAWEGRVIVGDVEPKDVPLRRLSQRVGTVFQNPENQLFMLSVADDVAFGCENLLLPSEEIRARVEQAMRCVGLSELGDRPVFSLSGGQKQRCAMAGVLAMAPEILVLDEPTADLDGEGTEEVLDQLARLHRQGKTILLVEHKLEDASPLADRIVVMEGGRIAEDGTPREVLGSGRAGLNRLDLPDVVRLGLRPVPLTAAEAYQVLQRSGGTAGRFASSDRMGEVHQIGSTTSDRIGGAPRPKHAPSVMVRNLCFAYEQGTEVLSDLSFDIGPEEMVAVIGPNGSGKSTLFKLLMGLESPTSGEIVVEDVAYPALTDLIGKVGFLFQNPDEQLFCETVRKEIAFGPDNVGVDADVDAYLKLTALTPCADRHPHTLSRGERQRLALAALLAMEPALLLLDEPTTGLDRDNWVHVLQIAKQLAEQGKTVIFSTHNMKVVGEFADRVLLLNGGRFIADGSPRTVFSDDLHLHGLRTPQIVALSRMLGRVCLTPQELSGNEQ